MRIQNLLLPTALAMLSVACVTTELPEHETEPSPGGKGDDLTVYAPTVLIGAQDEGGSFDAVEGEYVEVLVPGNHVNGYDWGVSHVDMGFGQPRIDSMPPPSDAPLDAHGGTRFRWSTVAGLNTRGDHRVVLSHPRVHTGEAAGSFRFWVTVREPGRAAVWTPSSGRTTVDVTAGRDLVVELPVGATGTTWYVDETDAVLAYPTSSALVEHDRKRTYRLLWTTTAAQVGSHRVSFAETGASGDPLRDVGLTVRVAP